MRHVDFRTTLRYSHFQVIELADGIEALPKIAASPVAPRAEYMRNSGRTSVQSKLRSCNEGVSAGNKPPVQSGEAKPLNAQDFAGSGKPLRELAMSLPQEEF